MAEGEGAQSGAEGTQSGAEDSTTGTGGDGSNSSSEGTQGGATESKAPTREDELANQLKAQQERTRAADQRAAKIEQELKQLRDKDLPEQEKLKRDYDDATKRVTDLEKTNQQLALQVAFLKDNSVKWHNPERALKLVDLSQVTVNEDGSVSGMRDALTALAKSDPYLVEKETVQEAKPPSTSPGTNGSSGTGKPAKSALAARLPVMRTRVKP